MRKWFGAPSAKKTSKFYDDLMSGNVTRGMWGAEARFDAETVSAKDSVRRYFVPNVARHVHPTDRVLDLGCGPGGFFPVLASLCRTLIGVDVAASFVKKSNEFARTLGLRNVSVVRASADVLPFDDSSLDAVILMDLLHHLENPNDSLREVARVLRPGGLVLVFEPNKLNPLVAVMCLLDPNERGLLRLGSKARYTQLLSLYFKVDKVEYNGLLIGPKSRILLGIAEFLNHGIGARTLGWLNARLFLVLRKDL